MLRFNIITLFPELIEPHLDYLPLKKGIGAGFVEVRLINLKDFAIDKRGTVDGRPYGGGVGMILRVEPIADALSGLGNEETHTVLLSPKGTRYTQKTAREYSKKKSITIICGRYEGVDARVEKTVNEVISIGDFILSGGELAALTIMESVVRLIPGIIEKPEATLVESFSNNKMEYPQYTRPRNYNGDEVPEVLLSGDHKKIEKWKNSQSTNLNLI